MRVPYKIGLPILAIVLGLGLAPIFTSGSGGATADPSSAAQESRPGLATVYEQIDHSTDCADLQRTFDRNMDRYEMMDASVRTADGSPGEAMFAYASAADDRMRAIGCY
jgi:hypothetical protein